MAQGQNTNLLDFIGAELMVDDGPDNVVALHFWWSTRKETGCQSQINMFGLACKNLRYSSTHDYNFDIFVFSQGIRSIPLQAASNIFILFNMS